MIVAILASFVMVGGTLADASAEDVTTSHLFDASQGQDDLSKEPDLVVSKEYSRYEKAMEAVIGLFQELGPDVLVIRDDPSLSETEREIFLAALLAPYDDFFTEYGAAHYALMLDTHGLDGEQAEIAKKQARSETQSTIAQMRDDFFRGLYSPYGDEETFDEIQ